MTYSEFGWNRKDNVINLSSITSDTPTFTLLRGLGFVIAPHNIPYEKFMTSIEDVIEGLAMHVVEEVGQDCSVSFQKANTPNSNITEEKKLALQEINENKDVVIMKVDK
ncbi:hypothetical protein KI387_028929, partial [Taxus chinensis]